MNVAGVETVSSPRTDLELGNIGEIATSSDHMGSIRIGLHMTSLTTVSALRKSSDLWCPLGLAACLSPTQASSSQPVKVESELMNPR